jgi:ABC-type Fe3+ transport system substrate-binding protein
VSGATEALNTLIPMGAFDPLEPSLVLPDVKSPTTWRGGALPFRDPERRLFVMAAVQRGIVYVNPHSVGTDEISSYWDLLEPRWRGRIVADDPRVAGAGQATFGFFYLHPDLGPEFIRLLAEQHPLLLRDYRQEVDQVARGNQLILIGTSDVQVEPLIKAGVPISIVDPSQIKEGSGVTAGNSNLALFNRAPHPNAARLYVNWLLSKQGQTGFVRAEGYVSQRLDVTTDHAAAWRVPVPEAIDIDAPESVELRRTQLMPLLYEVFGR